MPFKSTFANDVFEHLKAGFPILYVNTWEESRAERQISEAALEQKRSMWRWSSTKGWAQEHDGLTDPTSLTDEQRRRRKTLAGTSDPIAALTAIEQQLPADSVFVMRDFHFYMDSFEVIRRMRDLFGFLKASGRTIIIIAPRILIPLELAKDITVISFDLPSRPDLKLTLDGIVDSVGVDAAGVTDEGALLDSTRGLTVSEAENVLALALVRHKSLGEDAIVTVQREKSNILKQTGILEFFEPDLTMDEIGGLNALKSWLRKRAKSFSDDARRFGLPPSRGFMMIGQRGCGKSAVAKAVAKMWKQPLLRFDVGRVFGSLVGQSEEQMRRALAISEAIAPCILWLDEIEKGLSGLSSSNFSDGGVTARVFGTMLTWMSERKAPVTVVGTCNNIHSIPPEFLRKGRFDELFFVDLPNAGELAEIFAIHITKRGRDPKRFDCRKLAQIAHGQQFSGSEAEEAVISGMFDAFDEGAEDVTGAHIVAAIESTKSLAVTMEEEVKALRAWAQDRARKATEEVVEVHRGRKIDPGYL